MFIFNIITSLVNTLAVVSKVVLWTTASSVFETKGQLTPICIWKHCPPRCLFRWENKWKSLSAKWVNVEDGQKSYIRTILQILHDLQKWECVVVEQNFVVQQMRPFLLYCQLEISYREEYLYAFIVIVLDR